MPHLPILPPRPQTRLTTDAFLGLDRREHIPDGAWSETENLSLRARPALAPRPRRGAVATLQRPGGLCAKDALCWVDGDTLYVNGAPTPVSGLADQPRQMLSMGAYLILWPDRVYYNTADPADYGSLDADWRYRGSVRVSLCRADGSPWPSAPTVSDTEPDAPANLDLWIDTSGEKRVLRQYSASLALWTEVDTPYTRLDFTTQGQIPRLFAALDGVEISGVGDEALEGWKILYALGGAAGAENDYIVLAALGPGERQYESLAVRITRRAPDMDYLCECSNRLWGCRYGNDGARNLNEIYGCALGDFKNWRQYLGLATDSYAASVGSDGPWTGAVNYLGSPVFFKTDRLHRLTLSASGAHRLTETVCRGVQKGSGKSLCVVGETLYYQSDSGVCAWQGGFPELVSAALGEEKSDSAVGGALGAEYLLSRRRAGGVWELLTLDTETGLWLRQDALHVRDFAAADGEAYALDADTGAIWSLTGRAGAREETVPWHAVTGPRHYLSPDAKYPGRLDLRLRLRPGARVRALLEYDADGLWHEAGAVTAPADAVTDTVLRLPLRPRRCDFWRLRLEGEGEARLLALTQVLERGSDL